MSSLALSLTERFSLSIDGLLRAVAAAIVGGRMNGAVILLVWTRIKRTETRVLALVAAIRAGRVRGGWVVEARATCASAAPRAVPPAFLKVPRSFAWLIVLVPYHAAGYASQLRHLLAEPDMVALLAATPRLGKILRPLCRMLGIEAELLSPLVLVTQKVVAEVAGAFVVEVSTEVVPEIAIQGVVGDRRIAIQPGGDGGTWPAPEGGFFSPA